MTNETTSAELIMRLYDLRREATMREARSWFISFFPASGEDILKAMIDPKTSGYYRMVVSYWDMAASFVNRGAINEEMFLDSGGEAMMVFAKIEQHVEEVRKLTGNPNYAKHLETLVMKQPDAKASLAARRETLARMIEARAAMAESAYSK